MSANVSLSALYSFPGWVVENIHIEADSVKVILRLDKRRVLFCPDCGRKLGTMRKIPQEVSDIPLAIMNRVRIVYPAVLAKCANCREAHTFRPPGISANAQATDRLKRYVCSLCRYMPVNAVSEFVPISTPTARRWDKEVLLDELPEPDLNNLEAILVDEKHIGRHHGFITVVLDAATGAVLHLAKGKDMSAFASFIDKLDDRQKASILAVGMDRSGSYKAVVDEHLPNAEPVYDKFHLVKNYNEVLDKIRRDEWRKAESDKDKKFVKGQRYNLLRNRENLKPKQKESLTELLEVNENLNKAYLLKDQLKLLWMFTYAKSAGKYLDRWIALAKEAGIAALTKFADGLDRSREGILAYCKHRITSAKIESFNAKIARIVRRACGYRDLEYLYLKIRQEGIN